MRSTVKHFMYYDYVFSVFQSKHSNQPQSLQDVKIQNKNLPLGDCTGGVQSRQINQNHSHLCLRGRKHACLVLHCQFQRTVVQFWGTDRVLITGRDERTLENNVLKEIFFFKEISMHTCTQTLTKSAKLKKITFMHSSRIVLVIKSDVNEEFILSCIN